MKTFEKRKEFLAVFYDGKNFDEIEKELSAFDIYPFKYKGSDTFWFEQAQQSVNAQCWLVYNVCKRKWKVYANNEFQEKFKAVPQ